VTRQVRPAFLFVLVVSPWLCGFDLLRGPNRDVEEGNRELLAGQPDQALAAYDRAASAVGDDPALHFDRGTALLQLKRFDEAKAELQKCAQETNDNALESAAFYNLGNTFFEAKQYQDAVGAYIRTLRLDPTDHRAKWNLELALRAQKNEQDKKPPQSQPSKQPSSSPTAQNQPQAKKSPSTQPSTQGNGQKQAQNQQPKTPASQPASPPQPQQPQQASADKQGDMDRQRVDRLLDSLDHDYKTLATQGGQADDEPPPSEDW
jgi:tetratricopeptide (TPR) repeat protein